MSQTHTMRTKTRLTLKSRSTWTGTVRTNMGRSISPKEKIRGSRIWWRKRSMRPNMACLNQTRTAPISEYHSAIISLSPVYSILTIWDKKSFLVVNTGCIPRKPTSSSRLIWALWMGPKRVCSHWATGRRAGGRCRKWRTASSAHRIILTLSLSNEYQ